MDELNPRYILTRAAFLIGLLVAVVYGYSFFKKFQRHSAITAELQSITSDSSFFRQFYAEDAHKTLIRAIGLIAEANELGLPPDQSIDRGMGIKKKFFENDAEKEEPPVREKIIRTCLRSNYENFIKFGYKVDFHTLGLLAKGELPPIPEGPHRGLKPEITNLIDQAISEGMDRVIANLELRPPDEQYSPTTDIQIAAAKQLARELTSAGIIEDSARERILKALTKPAP